jgi:hypothetical protein
MAILAGDNFCEGGDFPFIVLAVENEIYWSAIGFSYVFERVFLMLSSIAGTKSGVCISASSRLS